jgi:ATP-dependent DNA ligase
VFDMLADDGGALVGQILIRRRAKLEAFAEKHLGDNGTLRLSPATTDITVARQWLALAGGSLDGVVAKRLDLPYQPGTSRGMQKIKRIRTVDCVVGGVILRPDAVSHLLLGLYDDGGLLNFIGSAPLKVAEGKRLAGQIAKLIQPPGFTGKQPGEVRTQFGHRMGEWQPLAPNLVAEVQYDHYTGGRFRHGARFLRWRPDKAPLACLVSQVHV